MPTYDSDSSEDAEDYSTTNVTLGYATADPTGDEISHLGGYPTWLDPSIAPPAALAKCKVCNSCMSLLLQLNADLQQYFPNDDRRLHVLCCRKKQCSKKGGSVRAFREVRKPQAKGRRENKPLVVTAKPSEPSQDLGSALFGGSRQSASVADGSNPFSTSSVSSATTNPFATASSNNQSASGDLFASLGSPSQLAALTPQRSVDEIQPPIETFAEKLKIGTGTSSDTKEAVPQESWPPLSAFPPSYPSLYLDAYPEELEKQPKHPSQPESSRTQYDVEDSTGVKSKTAEKDLFESSLDKTFQRFSDRIAQNPEQVLRYEFKGEPLLYSGTDDAATRFVVPHAKAGAPKGIPRCDSCGGQRVFEIQLVPGLIYELEKNDDLNLEEGMEWGQLLWARVATTVANLGGPHLKKNGLGCSGRKGWPGSDDDC